MNEPTTPPSPGIALMIVVAAGVLAVGVAVFSVLTLWQAGKTPAGLAQPTTAKEESPTASQEPAVPDLARPAAPAPEAGRRNLTLDPDTMAARQELSRQQAQAFRAINRENTNLSFHLTEQEIQTMEKEGVRVQ